MDSEKKNIAYIDGQNLYMGTTKSDPSWRIDLIRFRVYLEMKYNVAKAYYYLGYLVESNQELYEQLQSAGFIVVFREHNSLMLGKKKGPEFNLLVQHSTLPKESSNQAVF